MIELLMTDKKNNPSNYSLVILSEGAHWEGYEVKEYGEPDAFGHRKKFSVAEAFSDELMARTRAETVVSDLTYDLRSGAPDFLDTLVATTFATMAYDAFCAGNSGLMAGIVDGRFSMVQIPDPKLGPRHVDVDHMYNKARYRPSYASKAGLSVFLTHAS
jgi:6-phosphofructokinase 1